MTMENDIAEVLVSAEAIQKKVAELGQRISQDYAGQRLLMVGLLRGAIVFMADLMRSISIPVELDFIGISSYGTSTESGQVRLVHDLERSIEGRHVLIVEDIIDTGKTLSYLVDQLRARRPASLRICALLDKPERRAPEVDVQPDYLGFVIPDRFVVGYGLDFAEGYRNLPFVGVLKKPLYKKVLLRGAIVQRLGQYMTRQIDLEDLVAWAHETLESDDLAAGDRLLLEDLVARAQSPDRSRAGLGLEECAAFLQRLGYDFDVNVRPVTRSVSSAGTPAVRSDPAETRD
jgi:hypoxanthine phosphoribosyltransferase